MDAEGEIAGRLAAKIVKVIMGKHKPIYDRAQNMGDFVVVVNADKIAFTGKKRQQKVYRHHTGWPGGLVTTPVPVQHPKCPCMLRRFPAREGQNVISLQGLNRFSLRAGRWRPCTRRSPRKCFGERWLVCSLKIRSVVSGSSSFGSSQGLR